VNSFAGIGVLIGSVLISVCGTPANKMLGIIPSLIVQGD